MRWALETLKKLVARLGVGFALGVLGSMLAGPSIIGWYFRPLAGGAAALCANDVEQATRLLVKLQFFVGLAGGAFVPLVMFLVGRMLAKRREDTPLPSKSA
jgi:hypothetical protein